MRAAEPTAGAGPVPWSRYVTTEVDEAHAFLRAVHVDFQVRLSEDTDGVELRSDIAGINDVVVHRLHYSARMQAETEPNKDLAITHFLRGRFSLVDQKQEYRIAHGGAVLSPPGRSFLVDLHGVDLAILTLPHSLVEEAAHELSGVAPSELRFDSPRPISASLEQHWLKTAAYVQVSVLGDVTVAANPLIAGPACRLLAQTALAVFPNTATSAGPGMIGNVAPAVVRRAMAYAEENAAGDVTLAQMAAAAGVGPRALQEAFRRHQGTTPTSYLRRIRLEHAHRDLQAADPRNGDTVAEIAASWGFVNPARFSTHYRAAYGRPPSRTLRA